MLKKLTKLVTNNFGLKVAALFFSVVLWLVVVNIDDPTQAKNFTTSITITNSDYMTQDGQEITLNPGKTWVEIVENSRASQNKISAE